MRCDDGRRPIPQLNYVRGHAKKESHIPHIPKVQGSVVRHECNTPISHRTAHTATCRMCGDSRTRTSALRALILAAAALAACAACNTSAWSHVVKEVHLLRGHTCVAGGAEGDRVGVAVRRLRAAAKGHASRTGRGRSHAEWSAQRTVVRAHVCWEKGPDDCLRRNRLQERRLTNAADCLWRCNQLTVCVRVCRCVLGSNSDWSRRPRVRESLGPTSRQTHSHGRRPFSAGPCQLVV